MTDHPDMRRPAEEWASQQIQDGMAFLLAERHRQVIAAENVAAWQAHIRGCDERADYYDALASAAPAAHRDHHYYRRLADEQRSKAAFARRQMQIDEGNAQ